MITLNKTQIKELEEHLLEYHQVDRVSFGEVAKNNLLAITQHFKSFTVRYITISSGNPKTAMVHTLNTL